MNRAVAYNHLIGVSDAPVGSGSDGGDVEDVLRRLDRVETSVVELRAEVGEVREQVGVIAAKIPYLATAASVAELKTEMVKSMSELRSEMTEGFSELRSEMAASDSKLRSEMTGLRSEMAASDSALRSEITGLRSEMATSVSDLKSENKSIAAIIPHLLTAASLAAAETRIIKWFIGTAASLTALVSTLAFTIAKF